MYCFENNSKTKTVTTEHNWSRVFEQGLSYSAEASAEFEGIGLKESVTMSVTESYSNGGSVTESETLSRPCVASSHTKVICTYMAYRGEIKVGYTIHWKDGSTTRGQYKGEGWHHDTLIKTYPL